MYKILSNGGYFPVMFFICCCEFVISLAVNNIVSLLRDYPHIHRHSDGATGVIRVEDVFFVCSLSRFVDARVMRKVIPRSAAQNSRAIIERIFP